MARIGIFGGSFDPVHNGHLVMALEAVEAAHLDRLLVIPARQAPHKRGPGGAPAAIRARLLRLAFEGLRTASVDERELARSGLSYTVETVREIRAERPGDRLFLLIGADSLRDLPAWRDSAALARLCTFLVAPRPGWDPAPPAGFSVELLGGTPMGVSSTEVRRRAAAGLPLHGFVPPQVARAIQEEELYRVGGD